MAPPGTSTLRSGWIFGSVLPSPFSALSGLREALFGNSGSKRTRDVQYGAALAYAGDTGRAQALTDVGSAALKWLAGDLDLMRCFSNSSRN